MLAKKELVLLETLLDAQGSYLSSLTLAKEIGMTDRTTRKYLQHIATFVKEHGAQLISKQGHGYCLEILDEPVFESFWQDLRRSKADLTDIRHLEATEDRQRYILQKLLFDQPELDVDSLLATLFVSKTTLTTDLNHIKQTLLPYGLTLNQQNRKISISGDEQAVRRFLKDYFVDVSFEASLLGSVMPNFISDVDFSQLMLLVLEECRQGQLRLSDFVLHNLVLHLALMVQRLKLGYPLTFCTIDKAIQASHEHQVALKIVKGLEELLDVSIPSQEADYIALHLKTKHSEPDRLIDSSDNLRQGILSALTRLGQLCHCDLANDRHLVQGLLAHFTPFLSRLNNHIQLTNPLLADLQSKYPVHLDLTKTAFQDLPELRHQTVSDDEWAYISLHVIAAVERQTRQRQVKALVVCATGYGSAMMLKSRLESEFGSSLTIVDVVSYYEVSEERLRDIDVIISSLTLPNHLFLTPVINVSVFLTDEEVAQIRTYLGSRLGVTEDLPVDKPLSDEAMLCLSLFNPDQVLIETERLSREELLDKMIAKLTKVQLPNWQTIFRQEVDVREGYSSVVYGDCLAFPHPVRPLGFAEEVVLAICPNGIDWDENHKAVTFVFLLSPAKQSSQGLKHLSPRLVDFVADKSLQEALLQDPSYDQLVTIFKTLLS